MFQIAIDIPSVDLEAGYNHVNHARTLHYLEQGRLRFLEHIGYPNEKLLAQDLFLVIAHIDISYKREIFAGQYLITVDKVTIEKKELKMSQRVINNRDKECVSAVFDFRLVDGKLKRSVHIPGFFVNAIHRSSTGDKV